jgi:predicted acyl esterase
MSREQSFNATDNRFLRLLPGSWVLRTAGLVLLALSVVALSRQGQVRRNIGARTGRGIGRDRQVTMADSVRLATNLYFPGSASPPFATVLIRLPYDKNRYGEARRAALSFT